MQMPVFPMMANHHEVLKYLFFKLFALLQSITIIQSWAAREILEPGGLHAQETVLNCQMSPALQMCKNALYVFHQVDSCTQMLVKIEQGLIKQKHVYAL